MFFILLYKYIFDKHGDSFINTHFLERYLLLWELFLENVFKISNLEYFSGLLLFIS